MSFEINSPRHNSQIANTIPVPALRRCATSHIGMSRQAGVTLVLSLIFLLLLTILGVTSMSTNTLQEKMTGNMHDKNMAFHASESALRAGEIKLQQLDDAATNAGGKLIPDATGSSGVWLTTVTNVTDDNWWPNNSLPVSDITEVAADPRYLIEELAKVKFTIAQPGSYGPPSMDYYYRITARGIGVTNLAQTMLQETFRITH